MLMVEKWHRFYINNKRNYIECGYTEEESDKMAGEDADKFIKQLKKERSNQKPKIYYIRR